ncbi:MAG: FecR family protein [Kiloniellales bacterium]
MADQRPPGQVKQRQEAEPPPEPFGPEFARLKGGRAFPPGFDARAIARRSRRRRRTLRGGGIALLAAALLWVVFDPSLTADYSAPVGTVERVTLPDGTVAHLDSGASISWSESGTERRVRLHAGIGLFETATEAAGSERDFVVEAAALEVRPLGTVFAVSAEASGWSALVQSGQVRISLPSSGASTVIGPGEAASIADPDGHLATSAIDVERMLAWRTGVLDFKNAPLAEVIATLERYRPGRILLLNDEAAARRFDGVLSLDDVDQALQIVAESSGLEPLANWPLLVVLQ